jgi:hypothetical protein
LAPDKTSATLAALRQAICSGALNWGRLVYQANLQLCTPLWYVRLRQDGLLELLPEDLQEYLAVLHQANRERNEIFRAALAELLEVFGREKIAVVLLKGAATFCDDLYGDPGARVLQDLDLLVDPRDTERCRELLFGLGYEEWPDPNMAPEGWPTDERHHHLFPFFRPGSPVVVELHFKVAYAQAGRVLATQMAWQNLASGEFEGQSAVFLNPTWRLLHNTAHALVPQCEFIRGEVSLLQLAEFGALVSRYGRETDWRCWGERGRGAGLGTEFSTYLALAVRLLGIEPPAAAGTAGGGPHLARLQAGGHGLAVPRGERVSLRELTFGCLVRGYYLLNLPIWVWRNVCYAEGGHLLSRLGYLAKKSLTGTSWRKI